MANDDILTDDYLAGLVSQDAKDCSLKYSAMGMDAYKSTKKPANAPRLNKRFLQNIIKDTKNHNAALLAKEKTESEARLRGLEKEEERSRLRTRAGPADIRKRQIGDINAILGKRPKRSDDSSNGKGGRDEKDSERHSGSRRSEREDDSRRKSSSRKSRRRDDDDYESKRRRDRRRDSSRHRSRSRSRSRSPSRKERKYRERSPSRRHKHSRDNNSQRRNERREKEPKSSRRDYSDEMSESSDPLEDIIGPAPPSRSPVRARGRGAISSHSGIDRRFSETYDPKMDVEVEDIGEGDWSDAVEAFRDRQKLRQNQEKRLRAAGFSDKELTRVKDDGEKSEADVKWGKKGERREWDIGKEDTDGDS